MTRYCSGFAAVAHAERDCSALRHSEDVEELTDEEADDLRDCSLCGYEWVPTLEDAPPL